MVFFWYYLAVIAFLCLVFGAIWWRDQRVIADLVEGAEGVRNRISRESPKLVADLSLEAFTKILIDVKRPRYAYYVLGVVSGFLLGSPVLLGILSIFATLSGKNTAREMTDALKDKDIVVQAQQSLGQTPYESTEQLYFILQNWGGFYYYIGILFFWLGLMFFGMHLFYKRKPEDLWTTLERKRAGL